tara:strand:+ start:1093 stop:1299 length:207 start_codon:yes stop_codon:yes gene_type:complete
MAKKEVITSNKDRATELQSRLEEVVAKRNELTSEVNQLNQLFLKLQGALELLEVMEDEGKEEKEKNSD